MTARVGTVPASMDGYDIVGLTGSLRRGSNNTALLRAAQEVAPEGMAIEIVVPGDIPPYNADVEREEGFPAPVAELRRRVTVADGLLFATPEYDFSVSGVLKNTIDWLSRGPAAPLDDKPAAIMSSAGGSGGRHALGHLRQMLSHNHLHVTVGEVGVRRGSDHVVDGTLVTAEYREAIRHLLDELARLIDDHALPPPVRGTLLVVGADSPFTERIARRIASHGLRSVWALTVPDALDWITIRTIAAAVLDPRLDRAATEEVTQALAATHPEAPVVMPAEGDDPMPGLIELLADVAAQNDQPPVA